MPIIGTQQSPIRIVTADTHRVDFPKTYLDFQYAGPLPGKYKGDNFEFDNPSDQSGKVVFVDKNRWVIRKIHIHSPAEHLIDENEPSQYEAHLLHSAPDDPKARKEKLVIGVFFRIEKKAQSKPTLAGINERLKGFAVTDEGEKKCDVVHALPIDPREFLPADRYRSNWYRYEGSLTSEPYSEDVNWFVMAQEIAVLTHEIDEVGRCANQHTRTVYSLDRRFVLRSFR